MKKETEIDSLRKSSLMWWNNELTQEQRDFHFSGYEKFTPAKHSSELTGREIQNIWAVNQNPPTPVKETEPEQPYYKGKGEHSVNQLEAICSQYKEYVSFLNSRGNDTTPTSKEGLEDGGFTIQDDVWPSRRWNKERTEYIDLSGNDSKLFNGGEMKWQQWGETITISNFEGDVLKINPSGNYDSGIPSKEDRELAEKVTTTLNNAPAMYEALNEVINHCNFICAAHGGDIYEKMMEHKSIKKAEAILTRINKD